MDKLALLGVGLLGGSLGLAVRGRRLAGRVEGWVRRLEVGAEAESLGAVDRATTDLAAVVEGADLVVLCTPIGQMRELARRTVGHLNASAVVTDVGSVKEVVVRELEPVVAAGGASFVGSHPMAGGEKTGVRHARADLFVDALCVVTPTAGTDAKAAGKVEGFWRALGARTVRMTPEQHDELVSRASHLPQVLASVLATCVLDPSHPTLQAELCAGGFRDTTRIASSSPEMWRDIALANRGPLLRALDEYGTVLAQVRRWVDASDGTALLEFFARARARREGWMARNQQTANGSEHGS